MPIKNYASTMPADKSIARIQDALVSHGAEGLLFEYEPGTGRIKALKFLMGIHGNTVGFSLPVDWKLFQAVLKKQGVRRWDDEEYCYRVAWANLRDWVDSQMALLETRMVEMPQIFLPFALGKDGQTLYEKVSEGKFFLN
jgi:hypothetical protein